jgi:dienelactone hydrolase
MYRNPAHSDRNVSLALRSAVLVLATILALLSLVPIAHAQDYGSPGPFAAGWKRVTVPRADRSTFTARVYYPARARGQDAPNDKSVAPYPAIVFGHGYQIQPSFYASTLEHLASWGYVVCAPESGLEVFPNHRKFADDMGRCFSYLQEESGRRKSWLYEQIDPARLGASGHSMGAGASILAAAAEPRIRAVVNLAAADTNPSAATAMANVAAPVRLIVGSADGIVGPSQTAAIYSAARSPRQLSVLQGGWHCGFIDSNYTFCDAGDMTRSAQLAHTRRLLTEFFNLYLKGEQDAWDGVWGPGLQSDPAVRTQADPGVAFAASEVSDAGPAGGAVAHTLTLTNGGPRPASFTVFFQHNGWETSAAPAQTAILQPGTSAQVVVRVTVPADAAAGSEDTVQVSARNDADGGTRTFATVRTSVQ